MATDIVQIRNPRTKRYVKVDRNKWMIVSHKKSDWPYEGVPIFKRKK